MEKTFKSHGQSYDIKETGERTKHTKAHTDFNGYDIPESIHKITTFGVFKDGQNVGKVNGDGAVMINGEKAGKIKKCTH